MGRQQRQYGLRPGQAFRQAGPVQPVHPPPLFGMADQPGAMPVAGMPEAEGLDPKAAAARAGPAPITRQSGQRKGKPFVQGGRKQLRRAVCRPALKAKYEQRINAGKAPEQAITALMRKLIVPAKAVQKGRPWQPKPA
jgi:transposase